MILTPLRCLAVLTTVFFLPAACNAETVADLDAKIDALIHQRAFAHANWGIHVVRLDSGQVLYTHRTDKLLLPASVAKLYIAGLVLDTMNTHARIPTRLLGTGALHQGQLEGSLVLQGMGDPTLGTKNANPDWVDQLARQLVLNHVRHVHGDLVVDDSYLDNPPIGHGWEAGDLSYWFAAPSSALNLEENMVTLSIQPGRRPGNLAQLKFTPGDAAPGLSNTLVTTASDTPEDINLYRAPGGKTLYAFGTIPVGVATRDYRLAITHPAMLAGQRLRRALTNHGIRIDGHMRLRHWPQDTRHMLDNARLLGQVLSPPLIEIISEALKRSQNLYAQNLLQLVGVKAHAHAEPTDPYSRSFHTSTAWGLHALGAMLDRIGIPRDTVILEEGTGMSRKDLTTPNALVHLLSYFAAQPYAAQWHGLLPIAAIDGTLKSRMHNSAAAGNVHAKTGHMTHITSLAGYVTTASGEALAFAIMLNSYTYTSADSHPNGSCNTDTIDAIVRLLASFQDHNTAKKPKNTSPVSG